VVTVRGAIAPQSHPHVAKGRRGVGRSELLLMQRACLLIDELGADLDRQLLEPRAASEQVRLLRGATARITRAANDAIQAYQRGRRAVDAALAHPDRDNGATIAMRASLQTARRDLLQSLRNAGRRYPWAPELDTVAPPVRLTSHERV
jgi:hypothetical protein